MYVADSRVELSRPSLSRVRRPRFRTKKRRRPKKNFSFRTGTCGYPRWLWRTLESIFAKPRTTPRQPCLSTSKSMVYKYKCNYKCKSNYTYKYKCKYKYICKYRCIYTTPNTNTYLCQTSHHPPATLLVHIKVYGIQI